MNKSLKAAALYNISVNSKLLVEQVTQQLVKAIIDGTLPMGIKLVETDLEAKLGVSRTPLREAFRVLEKHGFVEIIPRRGTFVRTLYIGDVEEVQEVRISLETLAIRLAYRNMTPEGFAELDKELVAMEAASENEVTRAFLQHHDNYHGLLIKMSKNKALCDILTKLRSQTNWHRFYFKFDQQHFGPSLESHKIVHALLKDPGVGEDIIARVDEASTRMGCERLQQYAAAILAAPDQTGQTS